MDLAAMDRGVSTQVPVQALPDADAELKEVEAAIEACCHMKLANILDNLHQSSSCQTCTSVWSQGAIAYRCRTCQKTTSSALCVACFQAGNHEGHDYVMYRSGAGGCCDCGDLGSWSLEGCCPRHRPGAPSDTQALSQLLGAQPAAVLNSSATLVLLRAVMGVQRLAGGSPASEMAAIASGCIMRFTWLSKLSAAAPTRAALCSVSLLDLQDITTEAAQAASLIPASGLTRHIQDAVKQLQVHTCPGPAAAAGRKDCLIRRLLACMGRLPADVLHELTTLLLLQCYDNAFKTPAMVHFLDCYAHLLHEVATPPTSGLAARGVLAALDRLTVQLFNNEEAVLRVAQEHNLILVLLKILSDSLHKITELAASNSDTGAVSSAINIHFSCLRRVLGDVINTCHYPAVAHLLMTDASHMAALLQCLTCLQAAAPQTCTQPGKPPAQEVNVAVPATCNMEILVNSIFSELMHTCMSTRQTSTDQPRVVQLDSLAAAARECMDMLCNWACAQDLASLNNDTPASLEVETLYDRLKTGAQSVSPHLPIHRATSFCIQALLSCEMSGSPEQAAAARQVLAGLLRQLAAPCSPPLATKQQPAGLSLSQAVVRHPSIIQAWISQVGQLIWFRNEDDTRHVVVVYTSWRESFQDLDMLMMKFALAAGPAGPVLMDLLQVMGAGGLLRAAGVVPGPGVDTSAQAGQLDLHACETALRTLVCVLRDRIVCGAPAVYRMRQIIVHHLAVADAGHAQLVESLSQDLQYSVNDIEQVLSEVATFKPPTLSSAGTYSLRDAVWEEFDPHYLHLSRRTLPKALERAAQKGVYKPHWQLKPPNMPLSSTLQPMMDALAQPELCKLLVFIIQRCASPRPDGMSEDLLLSALNLLALQLHHMQFCVSAVSSSCPPGSVEPTSSSPASKAVEVMSKVFLGGQAGPFNLGPGVLHSLAVLSDPDSGSGSASAASQHAYSNDVVDCCKHLITRWQEVSAVAQDVGLISKPTAGPPTDLRISVPPSSVAALDSSQGGGLSPSKAAEAKAKAKERQLAMMARIKAQQSAFLQQREPEFIPLASTAAAAVSAIEHESDDDEQEEEQERVMDQERVVEQEEAQEEEQETVMDQERVVEEERVVEQEEERVVEQEEQEAEEQGEQESVMQEASMDLLLQLAQAFSARFGSNGTTVSEQQDRNASGGAGADTLQAPVQADSDASAWQHQQGSCVVCHGSESTQELGPLGWLGHMGVCTGLSAPFLHPPQPMHDPQPLVLPCVPHQPSISSTASASTDGTGSDSSRAGGAAASGVGPGLGQAGGLGQHQSASNQAKAGPSVVAYGQQLVKSRLCEYGPATGIVDWHPGLHVHSCGHMMHWACFEQYRANLLAGAAEDNMFAGFHHLHMPRREFTCPMCRRLSNCLLPASTYSWRPRGQHRPQLGDSQGVEAGRTDAVDELAPSAGGKLSPPESQGQVKIARTSIGGTKHRNSNSSADIQQAAAADSQPHTPPGSCMMVGGVKSLLQCMAQPGDDWVSSGRLDHDGDVLSVLACILQSAGQAFPAFGFYTWADVAEKRFAELAPMVQDLGKQVALEATQYSTCQERGLEARAVIMTHDMPDTPDENLEQEQLGGGVMPAANNVVATLLADGDAWEVVSVVPGIPASVAGVQVVQGVDTDMARPSATHASEDASLPGPFELLLFLEPSLMRFFAPSMGHVPSAHHQHRASDAYGEEDMQGVTTDTHEGVLSTLVPAGGIAAGGIAADQDTHMSGGAALDGLSGDAGTQAAVQSSPEQLEKLQLTSSEQLTTAGGPVALDAAGAQPIKIRPWALHLYGESPTEQHRRWAHAPLVPSAWALLAHNLAHWEAVRRPVALSRVACDALLGRCAPASTRAAPHTGSPSSRSRAAGASVTPAAAQPTPPGASSQQASAAAAAAMDTTTASVRMALSQGDAITGLKLVEGAHVSALQSLVQMCVALGAFPLEGQTASRHLHSCLTWLLLGGDRTGLSWVTADTLSPVCISAGLLPEYSRYIATKHLHSLFGTRQGQQHPSAGLKVLLSQHTPKMQQLIADPFLLVLELLALSLSAHESNAALVGGQAGSGCATTADVLTAVLQVVLPMLCVQSVAWVVSRGQQTSSGVASQLHAFLCRAARHESIPAAAVVDTAIVEATAGHALPVLVRVYLLHCLLAGCTPSQDLLISYTSLNPTAQDQPCIQLSDQLCTCLGVQNIATALQEGAQHLVTRPVHSSTPGAPPEPPSSAVLSERLSHWVGHIIWARSAPAGEAVSVQVPALPAFSITAGAEGRAGQVVNVARRLLPPPVFIPLPEIFQDLLLQMEGKTCYLCGHACEHPSLCLLTGRLLCTWWKGCTRSKGGGLLHAMESCGGATMMLSLKTTKVMSLRPHRLTICQSPYLDAHGEEDVDLKRGRPLYLNMQVYGQLSALWANSATEFDSHMLESSRVDLHFL